MEKPLIIAYYEGDEEVKILSNFAKTPFTLDGVQYYTVEAFWQSLKVSDPELRTKVAALRDGFDAKQVSKLIPSAGQIFVYEGNMYRVGSEAHHILLERALRAKVAQNASVRDALITTGKRPFRHMLKNRQGTWRSGDSPALPAITFEKMWERIRQELQEGTFQATLPLPTGINDFNSFQE